MINLIFQKGTYLLNKNPNLEMKMSVYQTYRKNTTMKVFACHLLDTFFTPKDYFNASPEGKTCNANKDKTSKPKLDESKVESIKG